MNPEYKRHAYARTILYELAYYLKERFIAAELPPKSTIVCEEVLYADRVIPQGDLHAMLNRIGRMEEEERRQMARYEMLLRPPDQDEPPSPPKEPANESTGAPKRKRKTNEE